MDGSLATFLSTTTVFTGELNIFNVEMKITFFFLLDFQPLNFCQLFLVSFRFFLFSSFSQCMKAGSRCPFSF